MHYDTVIIGGGLAGLSAAFWLTERAKEAGQRLSPLRLAVMEKERRLGGKIWTHRQAGLVLERGPDSFLARKKAMIELSRRLGLIERLVPTGPEGRGAYILFQGRLHTIPEGMSTGIPTQLMPLVKTQLLSWSGKIRALGDLLIPRGPKNDESLGSFLNRRFGREVKERIAEPLLAGIYAGDTDALSIMATFPQFKELEWRYRSLLLAMIQTKRASRRLTSPPSVSNASEAAGQTLPSHLKGSTFLSFQGGLYTLIEALHETLLLRGVDVFTGRGARLIRRSGDHYIIEDDTGQTLTARTVVLAAPAFVADALIRDETLRPFFQAVQYASVANALLCYDSEPEPRPLPGSGFVVAPTERKLMRAATWTSRKWPHTTPSGKFLVRLYAGGVKAEHALEMDDETLMKRLTKEMLGVVGGWPHPQSVLLTRWHQAMPQYAVGHLERMAQLKAMLKSHYPGLVVAGSAYDGVGLPDVAESGAQAAHTIAAYLKTGAQNAKNA